MIKCPYCENKNLENTLFCGECVGYLLTDNQKNTDSLVKDGSAWSGQRDAETTLANLSQNVGSSILYLGIGDHKRQIELSLDKTIHLGRLDPASDTFPEVDLTNDGGLERGVSRRHARILCKDRQVLIEDLGSVNGTFINNKRLAPYLPETIQNGDRLQTGRLNLEIKLQ